MTAGSMVLNKASPLECIVETRLREILTNKRS